LIEGLLLLRDMAAISDGVAQNLSSTQMILALVGVCSVNGGISSIQSSCAALLHVLISKDPLIVRLLSEKNLIHSMVRLILTVDPSKNEEADTEEKAAKKDMDLIYYLQCISSIAHACCQRVMSRVPETGTIDQLCKANIVPLMFEFFAANFTHICSVHAIETAREYCTIALLSLSASSSAGMFEVDNHIGGFDLLFSAIPTLTTSGKVHVLKVLQEFATTPDTADAFLIRGCSLVLAKLLISLDLEVQKETEKLFIFLIKSTTQKSYLKTQEVLSALSKTANEASDPNIKTTAAKLLSLISSF